MNKTPTPPPGVRLPWAQSTWQQRDPHTQSRGQAMFALLRLPPPSLAAADTPTHHAEACIALGVVLDVFASQLRQQKGDSQVLASLVRCACHTQLLCDAPLGGSALAALVEAAASPTGQARQKVGEALAACVAQRSWPGASVSSVLAACSCIAAAADLIIADACLLLTATRAIQSRQI